MIYEIWSIIRHLFLWSLIPLIWWYFTARKKNFFSWVGLKAIRGDWRKIGVLGAVFFAITAISQTFITPRLLPAGVSAAEAYAGMGFSALIPALSFAISTGVGEEVFWRGFIGKRLIAKFGFSKGNLFQGLLFGLLHGAGFVAMFLFMRLDLQIYRLVVIGFSATFLAGLGGWLLGYLTEKASGGSLIPAILVHGLGNFLLAVAEGFNIT